MDRADIERVVRETLASAKPPAKKPCTCAKTVTLEEANALITLVMEEAERMGVKAVCAVCGAGARPVSVQSMDDAYIASYDIALNKAFTSAGLKMSTAKLGTLSAPGGELYGIQNTNSGQIVVFGGGEPLFKSGKIAGGLGVSGGSTPEDTALAEYGRRKWEELICR